MWKLAVFTAMGFVDPQPLAVNSVRKSDACSIGNLLVARCEHFVKGRMIRYGALKILKIILPTVHVSTSLRGVIMERGTRYTVKTNPFFCMKVKQGEGAIWLFLEILP